jgi:ribosomal protein L30E
VIKSYIIEPSEFTYSSFENLYSYSIITDNMFTGKVFVGCSENIKIWSTPINNMITIKSNILPEKDVYVLVQE